MTSNVISFETPLKVLSLFSSLSLSLSFLSAFVWGRSELSLHLALGAFSVFTSLFFNVSVIFYFVGTGRWIKDQAENKLRENKRTEALLIWEDFKLANKLKGMTFPFATLSLLLGLFTFILGGARDVGVCPLWVHPLLATLLTLSSWLTHFFLCKALRSNLKILDEVSRKLDFSSLKALL